jgi:hypothetical protein
MVRANMAVLLLMAVVVGGQAVTASSTIRQEVKALAGGSVSLRWVEARTHYQKDIRIPPFPPVPMEYSGDINVWLATIAFFYKHCLGISWSFLRVSCCVVQYPCKTVYQG